MRSWANGYGGLALAVPSRWLHNVDRAPHTQAGPIPGAEHAPVSAPHLELRCHHQKPAGNKASWSHSGIDRALCKPAAPHPQALCRAKSVFMLPQGVKGRPPPAQQLDMSALKPPASSSHERLCQGGTFDACIGAGSSSGMRAHHKEVQCISKLPLSDPQVCFTFAEWITPLA